MMASVMGFIGLVLLFCLAFGGGENKDEKHQLEKKQITECVDCCQGDDCLKEKEIENGKQK